MMGRFLLPYSAVSWMRKRKRRRRCAVMERWNSRLWLLLRFGHLKKTTSWEEWQPQHWAPQVKEQAGKGGKRKLGRLTAIEP